MMFSQGNSTSCINTLNAELNPICYLLALLGAHHILHVSRIRVKVFRVQCQQFYIILNYYIHYV